MKKIVSGIVLLLMIGSAAARTASEISTVLTPFVEKGNLPGAVAAVVSPEGVLSMTCVGFADIEKKQPMTPRTMFWIASMTKYVTAIGVMILVDEGKLKLDDPVGKYIPEMKTMWIDSGAKDGKRVLTRAKTPLTVRHLLTHTAGFAFLAPCQFPVLGALPLDVLCREYAALPLKFEPGTKYAYSNMGIDVAGRIIESVSGQSYASFLQTRIFDPLGMSDTTFFPTREQYTRMAYVYTRSPDGTFKRAAPSFNLYQLDAARHNAEPGGGLFSTPEDVAKFVKMIISGGTVEEKQIVSRAGIDETARKQYPDTVSRNQALCCQVDARGEYWSKGGMFGTNFAFSRTLGLGSVWMVQVNDREGHDAAGRAQAAFNKAILAGSVR